MEGSALNRHVVTSDINPLATFISRCEVTCVDVNEYTRIMSEILSHVRKFPDQFYCTNNMTISTDNWQDGRPVAWAKHAYWTSNQFVEVNPSEYIEKRMTAIKSALVFQKEKFKQKNIIVDTFKEMLETNGACMILNTDSRRLPVPDESVDMVLTDPPYGGNVQYGELSAFWLAWIYDELDVTIKQITELDGEILIHRKNKVNAKTYQTYYEGLRRVYSECYRVLKKGQPMVFTFNSKDAKVWIAVQKAAIDAGLC